MWIWIEHVLAIIGILNIILVLFCLFSIDKRPIVCGTYNICTKCGKYKEGKVCYDCD